jgi:hypothetical protein
MKKLIGFLSVLIISIFSGFAFGDALNINPLIPGVLSFVSSYSLNSLLPQGCLYNLVYTSPAAAATYQFNLNYIPQFIIYDHAAAPLTSLRIDEANWGTLLNLPLAGITDVRYFMRFGLVASTVTKFRLATGNIKNMNVTVTLVQPGAVAIPFYACSDNEGTATQKPYAFQYQTLAILAGQPYPIQNFTSLFLSNLAATDTVLVEFSSGYSQTFNRAELLELTSLYQNSQLATGFIINNVNAYISRVTINQAAAGAAYLMKVLIPGQ